MMTRRMTLAFALALTGGMALAQQDSIEVAPLNGTDFVPLDEIDNFQLVPSDEVDGGLELAPSDGNSTGLEFMPSAGDEGSLVLEGMDDALDGLLDQALDQNAAQLGDVTETTTVQAAAGQGAVLRGLDKLAGTTTEMDLSVGETREIGYLTVTLGECRYPVDNPAGDAFAYLVIRAQEAETPIFQGWMIASSPALSALDDARYDVWVTSCTTA